MSDRGFLDRQSRDRLTVRSEDADREYLVGTVVSVKPQALPPS